MRYIGSKVNLLPQIRELVDSQAPNSKVFCDLFSGTGVVGREFKSSHQVISNDILYFSYVLNAAYVGLGSQPLFDSFKRVKARDPVDLLNSISVSEEAATDEDFIALAYSPLGTEGRQYLSVENALRLDRMRQEIERWHSDGLLEKPDYEYLIACLIEVVPSVSNTTGTYGAYLKHWDKRALKQIQVSHLPIFPTNHLNRIYNRDANDLIHEISGDVLYLDTPYNARQYSTNYHLLETLAKYDNPQLKGKTGLRVDNSGESLYCRKQTVFEAYESLLLNADFETLVMSYSSEGILSEAEILRLVLQFGRESSLVFQKIPYRRYKRREIDEATVFEFLIAVSK